MTKRRNWSAEEHFWFGSKKKNWKYYLKKREFWHNYGNLEFDEQVDKIIEVLMRGPE